jgi:hypothetical protein
MQNRMRQVNKIFKHSAYSKSCNSTRIIVIALKFKETGRLMWLAAFSSVSTLFKIPGDLRVSFLIKKKKRRIDGYIRSKYKIERISVGAYLSEEVLSSKALSEYASSQLF